MSGSAGTPLLSIVTVVKDDSEGLTRTLESLASVDDPRVSITIIDSSTDSVTEIISHFAHLAITVRHSPPRGVYPAMNEGLEAATGEYLWFLNAGDELTDARALEEVLTTLSTQRPTWLVGRVTFTYPDGEHVTPRQLDYQEEKRHHFARGLFPPHQGTIVRRREALCLGGFDTSYRITADYKMALQFSCNGDPVLLNAVLAKFTTGGLSTTRWRESLREFRRARLEVFDLHGRERVVEGIHAGGQFARIAAARSWAKFTR